MSRDTTDLVRNGIVAGALLWVCSVCHSGLLYISQHSRKILLSVFIIVSALSVSDIHAADPSDLNGISDQGRAYIGSVDAPVVLIEFSDYLCPFCGRYNRQTLPALVEKYVNAGELRIEFRHSPIAALHPTAEPAHVASECTVAQGATAFWEYHHALFATQSKWSKLPDPTEYLDTLALETELDIKPWRQCIKNGDGEARVKADIALSKKLKFTGTPSFQLSSSTSPDEPHIIVGARPAEYFITFIDALLAGEPPPLPPEQAKRELPDWAKPQSLAPNPDRPGFTISGDPYLGSDSAGITVVEFTDYQCPACARHALETQPILQQALLDTEIVRWVYKPYPLPEHQHALVAAATVECAARQGQFHQMHKKLFEQQSAWSGSDDIELAMRKLAADLTLNEQQFDQCLSSRSSLERVFESVHMAISFTRTTPVFILLDNENGRPIHGAIPPNQFAEYIEAFSPGILNEEIQEVLNN